MLRVSFVYPPIQHTSQNLACRAWMTAFQSMPNVVCELDHVQEAQLIFVFDEALARSLCSAHPNKCVLVWPHGLLQDAEESIRKGESGSRAEGLADLREIWVYPQEKLHSQTIFRLSGCPRLRMVPHIWQPSYTHDYFAPSRDDSEGPHLVLLTDTVSATASVLSSLIICGMARSFAKKGIRAVTIIAENPLLASGAVATAKCMPTLSGKVQIANMLDIGHFQQLPHYTVFLYWQTHATEFPETLWDLAYIGFPLIHNLKTELQFGVRVADGDVMNAAQCLMASKSSFNEAYIARNRTALDSLRKLGIQTIQGFLK